MDGGPSVQISRGGCLLEALGTPAEIAKLSSVLGVGEEHGRRHFEEATQCREPLAMHNMLFAGVIDLVTTTRQLWTAFETQLTSTMHNALFGSNALLLVTAAVVVKLVALVALLKFVRLFATVQDRASLMTTTWPYA